MRNMNNINRQTVTRSLVVIAFFSTAVSAQQNDKIRELIDRSVEAMGGERYLAVKDYTAEGRYYVIKGNRQAWTKFTDQAQIPFRSRYTLGKKSNGETTIFDLETGKGWIMEGDYEVKPATAEQLESFKQSAKHSLQRLFRYRIKEEGVTLHYVGTEILDGRRPVEIIELIDAENDTVKIYFEESSGLPARLEFFQVGKYGRKHQIFEEYSNWHEIQGVQTPMRIDRITDGNPSSQLFIKKMTYNSNLPDALFREPRIKSK